MELGSSQRALVRFAALLAAFEDDAFVAARLCEAARVVLGADGASLTAALLNTRHELLCATDEVTQRYEQLQEVAGEGPGYTAARTGELVTVKLGDTSADHWPALAVMTSDLEGTIWSVPLRPGRLVVGVMTLYRKHGPLLEELETVQQVADAVGTAMLQDSSVLAPDTQDTEAWSVRSRLHQASGMVIAQLGVASEDAVALIRAHAYAHDRDVSDVADDVIARRIDYTDFRIGGD